VSSIDVVNRRSGPLIHSDLLVALSVSERVLAIYHNIYNSVSRQDPRTTIHHIIIIMRLVSLFLLVSSASAWVPSQRVARPTTQLQATSRSEFLKTVATTTAGIALGGLLQTSTASAVDLPNGVSYEVIKSGDGPKPDIGELIAIRFAAYNGDIKIDDIFDTPEPYYTRLGSGGLIKGVEETLPLMRLGDRWKLTIPVCNPLWVFC